jgi:hypothetical protein
MRIYWKIEIKPGYKEILETVIYRGKKFENVDYLINISGFIEEFDCIYVGFDSERKNGWNTFWTWSHSESDLSPFDDDNDVIYSGIWNIREIRKEKLKKINNVNE